MHSPPTLDWGTLLLGPLLRAFLPLVALLGLILAAQYLFYRWKLNRLAQSGIDEIDRMSGREFEQYLEALFTKLGYQVERTPYVGDYGADLVVRKEGVKTVIQAKRHKSRVGVKAIGEVLRAKGNYGCSSAMLITNSSFTRQAEEEARTHGIELWDRDELIRRLLSIRQSGKHDPSNVIAEQPARPKSKPGSSSPVLLTAELQETEGAGMSTATCLVCGKEVSEKVKQYCLNHLYKFGGDIYCFEHQRRRSSG